MVLVDCGRLRSCVSAVNNFTSRGALCNVEIQGDYGNENCPLLPELRGRW